MLNIPRYAKRPTLIMRHVKRFHEQFVSDLSKYCPDTMRGAAWQIEEYLQEHGKYPDADFMRSIQRLLERIVQKQCNSDWTVALAKKDLRGRTTGVNQFTKDRYAPAPYKRPVVPRRLSQAITKKFQQTAPPQIDEKQS